MGLCYLSTSLLVIGLCLTLSECTQQIQPRIDISVGSFSIQKVGVYAPYINSRNLRSLNVADAKLFLIEDGNFGCPNFNISNSTKPLPRPQKLSSTGSPFVILTPLNGNCSDYDRARWVYYRGADAIVFYYFSTSEKKTLQTVRRGELDLTVARVRFEQSTFNKLRAAEEAAPGYGLISLSYDYQRIFQRSQTFYFVVFAFCILMTLSCMWFAMSYIKKFRLNMQARRRRVETQNEIRRIMGSLPVKSYKVSKGSDEELTCAVCLENFRNKDMIRMLPCDHEFHKKCIDPWIKIKRTCPMCKQNIAESISAKSARRKTPSTRSANHSRVAPQENERHQHTNLLDSIESSDSDLSNHIDRETQDIDPEVQVVMIQSSLDAARLRVEEGEEVTQDTPGHVAVDLEDN